MELKFIYSEKATEFCEISILLLFVCTVDKSKVEISQNFVAFSEYTNFNCGRITKLIMQQLHYASQYEILGSKVVMFPISMSLLEFPARKYKID